MLLSFAVSASGQKFDRGIKQGLFVPKGQWLTGGTVSYSQYGFDQYKFLILDQMQGNGYTFSISPFLGYFYRDNIAAGARFGYKRTSVKVDNISFDLGEDMSFNLKDYSNITQTYYGTAMLRTYTSLGGSRIFGLFNEMRLTLGGGQGKLISGKGEVLTGTYQDIYELQLGIAPGLAAFITNELAVEVSVGVLGFNYKHIKQVTDQIYEGSYSKSGANFKIDLFSINLGVAFYLPTVVPSLGKKKDKFRRLNFIP